MDLDQGLACLRIGPPPSRVGWEGGVALPCSRLERSVLVFVRGGCLVDGILMLGQRPQVVGCVGVLLCARTSG